MSLTITREGVSEEEAFEVFYPKYQINEELMAHAPESAWVMHYLPGNRNWEMTDAVWDGPQSAFLPLGETASMLSVAFGLHPVASPP